MFSELKNEAIFLINKTLANNTLISPRLESKFRQIDLEEIFENLNSEEDVYQVRDHYLNFIYREAAGEEICNLAKLKFVSINILEINNHNLTNHFANFDDQNSINREKERLAGLINDYAEKKYSEIEQSADEDATSIKRRQGGPFEQRIVSEPPEDLRQEVRGVIKKTIGRPSTSQSLKGVVTSGFRRTWRYMSEKTMKHREGKRKAQEAAAAPKMEKKEEKPKSS